MIWKRTLSFCISVLFCTIAISECSADSPQTRAEFAALARQVKPGMTEDEVRKLLGPPDAASSNDFRTTATMPNVVAVWAYGTTETGFPSWGRVYFTQEPELLGRTSKREVSSVRGGEGSPPERIEEKQLRRLLSVISDVSRMDGEGFDPGALILAVNELLPLGKDDILLVIQEYLRVSSVDELENVEQISLLLRALSEVPTPPGYLPPPNFGIFGPPAPKDLQPVPQFPLLIVDGVPLLLIGGYIAGGAPPNVEDDLQWFRQQGKIRKESLHPTREPWRLPGQARSLTAWKVFGDDSAYGEVMIRMQVLRLLNRTKELKIELTDTDAISDEKWLQVIADVKQKTAVKSLQWNAEKGRYKLLRSSPRGSTHSASPPPVGSEVDPKNWTRQ